MDEILDFPCEKCKGTGEHYCGFECYSCRGDGFVLTAKGIELIEFLERHGFKRFELQR